MYKKNFLLCTIAGTFLLSYFNSAYANIPPREIPQVSVTEGEQTFNNVIIRGRYTGASVSGSQSVATITNATLTSEMTSLSVTRGGRINAKDVNAMSLITGLSFSSGIINLEDSVVNVKGNHLGYGFVFSTPSESFLREGGENFNKAILNNTKILVKDGIGVLGPLSDAEIELKNSEIRADMLLRNDSSLEKIAPATLTLTANHSILEGRARGTQKHTTVLTLNNNSKWYLKISEKEVDRDGSIFNYTLLSINQRAQSSISVLNLNDSSIIFHEPNALTQYRYQTLHVGKQPKAEEPQPLENQGSNGGSNGAAVYTATGKAEIHLNSKWSDGEETADQKTDRLLVHGNVSGTTTIHFNSLLNSRNTQTEGSIPLNTRGLSLVQVSGKAEESSFKLANGYTTMGGMPYKYTLNAYGPTASRGKANSAQNLLGENENFWDFRLQSATLDPEAKIRALVPQVANYLVMPSALFSAGFADVNNQNILLDNMRTSAVELEMSKNKGIFFSSYGKKSTFSSSRKPLQYGYGANIRYAALQTGVTLAAIEEQDIVTNFGLLGTYGKLGFTPKDMEGSKESTLDKFSLAAYGSLHHDSGIYVNALFSYGALKGNITTALIGNTANIDHTKTWGASATIGQRLATGVEGLVFEPQAQL
ncbi:outer membrane autotransporter barrel domain-containing protein, partial [Bartonella vinsonii subsp. arupensis OK-94-513]